MPFNFIVNAIALVAEFISNLYLAAVNNVATIAHVASGQTLSIATSVAIGKAVVGSVIAYGLYQLGKPDQPDYEYLSGRKQFQVRPNPRRVIAYGKCWLSGAVVSQCSKVDDLGWGSFYLLAAIADHKMKELSNVKVFDQEFFTSAEKDAWKTGTNERTAVSAHKSVSVWRKVVLDTVERDAQLSNNTGFSFIYGFDGEDFQDKIARSAHHTDFRGGTGEGAPVERFNMRMVGVSWFAVKLQRTPKDKFNYWNQIPNFSFEVVRGNENLDLKFLFNKVDVRAGAGKYDKAATETLKQHARAALANTGVSSHFINLEEEEGDDEVIPQMATGFETFAKVKTALFEDIVSNYFAEGNAALCTADFLKRYTAYGTKVCGEYRINRESVLQAAADCEAFVDSHGNNTPLTANGAMPINRPDAVLNNLAMAMNSGAIVESGGVRYLHVGKRVDEDDVIEYTDDHVLVDNSTGDPNISFARTSSVSKRTSMLNVHYLDEEGLQRTTGVRAVDFAGSPLKRTTISSMELNFINNADQAEQVARVMMDRQWNSATVEFTLLDTSLRPKPFDVIKLNIDYFKDFPQRNFRVVGTSNTVDGLVKIRAVWEEDDLYTASEPSGFIQLPPPDTSLEERSFIWDDYSVPFDKASPADPVDDFNPGSHETVTILINKEQDSTDELRIH